MRQDALDTLHSHCFELGSALLRRVPSRRSVWAIGREAKDVSFFMNRLRKLGFIDYNGTTLSKFTARC
jgi:hypothetical protein